MYDMPEPNKPMIHLSDKDLPEIKDWKVGETYEVIVKMKMDTKMDFKKEISGTFKITEILVPEDMPDIKEMDNDEFMDHAGNMKRKYGEK